uniref:isopeptide-forming domain-containing fimbrial protein n=1 Tax=Marinicella meishanensis TaxID=2873263 RepID=UPI001CBD9BBA
MSVPSKGSVFTALLIFACFAQAQVDRNFTSRYSIDTNGGIEMIGNVLITCDEATTANCADIQSGVTNGNNNIQTRYVNQDPAGGFTNSSSATLTLPAGSDVLYAGLYWGGRFADSGGGANARRTINIKPPGAATYTSVSVAGANLDDFSSQGSADNRPYQVRADITAIVDTNGSGEYFVGGLSANNGADGLGFYGGWSIVVVYEDNSLPYRRLALYDGAARVTGTTSVSVTIGGLLTPASGDVTASVGALVWEGDQNIAGDQFRFEGTDLFTTGINPVNNFWNSSITKSGAHITNKNPNFVNQMGMDIDFHDIPLAIWGNSETEATIDFVTAGDSYYPNYLIFVTDLNVPDYSSSLSKTATDVNGGDIGRNDLITYEISFTNDGSDSSINTVVTDPIPANMTYEPGTLEIVSADAGPTGSLSDSAGDDAGEYDAGNDQVVIRVGNGADASNGGTIAPGESVVIRFQARIDAAAPTGDIDNTATINANSFQLPTTDFTFQDTATITLSDITPPTIGTCTVTPDPANNGTTVTATCNGVEAGSTLTIPGYTCMDNGGGNWSCTGTVGVSGVDGDETATATDAAGNTATTPANFTLDNTPPTIGTCTVTPDPANDGTVVTANCTGVEAGSTLTIPGYTCMDNGGGNWSCTGTVGVSGVDGDETATATDAAGNTATTPA